jgi:hypothetical protein
VKSTRVGAALTAAAVVVGLVASPVIANAKAAGGGSQVTQTAAKGQGPISGGTGRKIH